MKTYDATGMELGPTIAVLVEWNQGPLVHVLMEWNQGLLGCGGVVQDTTITCCGSGWGELWLLVV